MLTVWSTGTNSHVVQRNGGILMRDANDSDERFDCDTCIDRDEKKEAAQKAPRERSANKVVETEKMKGVREKYKAEGWRNAIKQEARKEGYEDIDLDEAEEQLRADEEKDLEEGQGDLSEDDEEPPKLTKIQVAEDLLEKGSTSLWEKAQS